MDHNLMNAVIKGGTKAKDDIDAVIGVDYKVRARPPSTSSSVGNLIQLRRQSWHPAEVRPFPPAPSQYSATDDPGDHAAVLVR